MGNGLLAVQDRDTYKAHQSRGLRLRKETLSVKKVTCPSCGHHKMFSYPSPMSVTKRKCSKCRYTEYK